MNNQEMVNNGTKQTMHYIERFLNLPFGKIDTTMKLKTLNDASIEFCVLNICTKGHQANENLKIDAKIKNILYNQVFWKIFDSYAMNDELDVQKRIRVDLKNESHWEIELNQKKNKNKIIFEFVLETPEDFLWINDAFEKWELDLIKKTKKKMNY